MQSRNSKLIFSVIFMSFMSTSCFNPGGISGVDMMPTDPQGEQSDTDSIRILDNVFLQESWKNGRLNYLISNQNNQLVNLNLVQNNQSLTNSIPLSPFGSISIEINQFYSFELIDVYKNGNIIGQILPPLAPQMSTASQAVMGTSFNAVYRTAPYWQIESETSTFTEGHVYLVQLKINRDFEVFILRKQQGLPRIEPFFKMLDIINIKSENLNIAQNQFGVLLTKNSASPEQDYYTAELTIRVPLLSSGQSMPMYLNGQSCNQNECQSNNLLVMYLVFPEGAI